MKIKSQKYRMNYYIILGSTYGKYRTFCMPEDTTPLDPDEAKCGLVSNDFFADSFPSNSQTADNINYHANHLLDC